MSHLGTHTSATALASVAPTPASGSAVNASSLPVATTAPDPTLAALQAAQAQAAGLFSPAAPAHQSALAALQAQAAKSSTSSLTASRFHPYGRPGGPMPAMATGASSSAAPDHPYLNPAAAAAVAYLGMPPMLYP